MKNAPIATLESLTEGKRKITYGVVKPGDPDPCEGIIFIRGGDISEGRINIPSLRTIRKDVSDQYKRTLLKGGELLVSLVGNPGEIASAPKKLAGANIARQVGLIDLTDDVCHKFVEWFLRSPQGQAEMGLYVTGAVQKVINLADLKRVRIPLPEIATQRKIASILSAYDDLIENNTRRIEILEEMARRLYEEWFVHFRFPGHEEVSLPFEEANIFDVFSVKYGKGLPKKNLVEDGEYPVYGAAKVIGRYTTFNYENRQIIAGCRGSVGEFRITEPNSFVTNNSFIFSPTVSDDFFWGYQALKHRGLKDVVGGAAQPQITLDGLRSVNIAYPEHDVRKAYSDLVSPMFSMMWSLERKNTNLRAQRDLLLPKLVSGEIDVSDIPMPEDKEVEAA